MAYKFAEIDEIGPLAVVEFKNLPWNVLCAAAVMELIEIYHLLEEKKSVEIIAITGMLNSFCAGADLKEIWELMETSDDQKSREAVETFNHLIDLIAGSSKITIAGIRKGTHTGQGRHPAPPPPYRSPRGGAYDLWLGRTDI